MNCYVNRMSVFSYWKSDYMPCSQYPQLTRRELGGGQVKPSEEIASYANPASMNLAYRQLAVIAVADFLHLTHYLSRPAFASVGL
jgi:hypothetical protein